MKLDTFVLQKERGVLRHLTVEGRGTQFPTYMHETSSWNGQHVCVCVYVYAR